MSARSSQPTLKPRSLTRIIPALLVLACSATVQSAFAWPWSRTADTPTTAPAPAISLHGSPVVERADLLPTWTDWRGEGRIIVHGVYNTRRTTFDVETGRPTGIRFAVAEPRLVYSYRSDGDRPPRIALTFDDGPSGKYTPQLLDIFAKHNARCTFFTLGALVGSHRQILQRAEQEGHEIAIHSWWHANYTGLSGGAVKSDIARCRTALDAVIDRPVRWVRPPYGAVNATVRSAINDAGYHVALWSVDPRDWQNPGSSVVARRILDSARDGAVVVLHDGGGSRAGTVAAMRTVVPELISRGYELVTLSELTGLSESPPQEQGMRLTIGSEQFDVKSDFEDVKVTIDGAEVELAEPPVMINDQFLVHARPVLNGLGARVRWNPETLAVAFDGVHGEFVVKLNSLEVTLTGQKLLVQIPSIYYRGTAMLPVWLMANATASTVQWNAETRTLEFHTSARTHVRPASGDNGLMTLRRHDGTRICWWPDPLLMSLLPPGDEISALI